MEYVQWVQTHWDDVLLAATSLITVASIIVKYTPNEYDDKIVMKIMSFLSLTKTRRGV